ncbi:MAG: fluoride efflux transporter FluC [Spirochaetota bacterium]
MWQNVLAIGFAGALGTVSRYALTSLVQNTFQSDIPISTLIVNVLGCFLFGLITVFGLERLALSPQVRAIFIVGFIGAFTTFSTFLVETEQFISHAQWLTAAGNVTIQVLAGLAAYKGGTLLGNLM